MSTDGQNVAPQVAAIQDAGAVKVWLEKARSCAQGGMARKARQRLVTSESPCTISEAMAWTAPIRKGWFE